MNQQSKEWFDKIIEVRQVTKVGKGKKCLRFRVIIIIGNKAGSVGIGVGKDLELLNAKIKSIANAKKNLLRLRLTTLNTIPQILLGKFKKAIVFLKPSGVGMGIRAGKTIKTIGELSGLKNFSSKQLGSNNVLNNANACFEALKTCSFTE